jgi:hypothetical protein
VVNPIDYIRLLESGKPYGANEMLPETAPTTMQSGYITTVISVNASEIPIIAISFYCNGIDAPSGQPLVATQI